MTFEPEAQRTGRVVGPGEEAHAFDDATEIIRSAARRFVAAALPVLRDLRLFPPPQSNPFVGVGHEYFGSELALPEQAALVAAIEVAHPRFSSGADLGV